MTTTARSPLRSLGAILFAALLALSLVASTIDALAATPLGIDRGGSDSPVQLPRDFFHGRGITWD